MQIGKTVFCYFKITANTTTPMDGAGNPIITLPVTSVSYTAGNTTMGKILLVDAATATNDGDIRWASTTTANIVVINVASTYTARNAITTTAPFTWTTNDSMESFFFYEAA